MSKGKQIGNKASSILHTSLNNREISSLQSLDFEFLRPSTKNGSRFDLRFKQIRGSLVDSNPFLTLYKLLKWKLSSFFGENDESWPKNQNELNEELPMQIPRFETYADKINYTWIGHSTAVIAIGDKFNILIDPVFLDRVSPYQWIGPKRFRPPACKIQDLPQIHLVLVSHDHYDHLETNALQKLYERNNSTVFIAGLGSKDVFPQNCQLIELDWTEEVELTFKNNFLGKKIFTKFQKSSKSNCDLKVTFVPACHYGRRGAFDMCQRLWGGFVIETKNKKKIYYSGDTGKCGVFEEIGKKFGYFDLSILPIGAYEPRQYLMCQHVNPEESLIIHKQVNSKKSVGVHWGTFPLGSEKYCQAKFDLKSALKKYQLQQDEFLTLNHGGSLLIPFY